MSITLFLTIYFIGGILAWLAWGTMFVLSRKDGFLESPVRFFIDFTIGSILPLVGWPFVILGFLYSVLSSK